MRLIMRYFILAAFMVAAALSPGGASAAPPIVTHQATVPFEIINECNGESVTLQGTIKMVEKYDADGSFWRYTTIHAVGNGDLGNKYVYNFSEKTKSTSTDPNNPHWLSYTLVDRGALISQGSAPNQTVIVHYDSVTDQFDFQIQCH